MSLVKNKESFDTKTWICAILLLVTSYPMWLWNTPTIVMLLAEFAILFIAIKNHEFDNMDVWLLLTIVFQFIFFLVYSINSNTNLTGRLFAIVQGCGFISIYLCKSSFWKETVECFIRILAVLLGISLIEYVLLSFFGISAPVSYIEECPSNPGRAYDGYLFNTFTSDDLGLVFLRRFEGFYDEPGVVGNIAMVLLYIGHFDLKKWYNIVLLLAGIFSFSLVFYIAVCAYFIFAGTNRIRIVFSLILIALIYLFTDNEVVTQYVFGRIQFENGYMSGYNRENYDFENWFNTISLKEYLIFGYTPRDKVVYTASWKWALTLYGVIPFLTYILLLIKSRFDHIAVKRDRILCLMLVFFVIVQRPFIHLYFYSFLLVIPFVYFGASHILLGYDNEKSSC